MNKTEMDLLSIFFLTPGNKRNFKLQEKFAQFYFYIEMDLLSVFLKLGFLGPRANNIQFGFNFKCVPYPSQSLQKQSVQCGTLRTWLSSVPFVFCRLAFRQPGAVKRGAFFFCSRFFVSSLTSSYFDLTDLAYLKWYHIQREVIG